MVADGRAPELDGSRSRLLVVGCLDSMTAESQSFALVLVQSTVRASMPVSGDPAGRGCQSQAALGPNDRWTRRPGAACVALCPDRRCNRSGPRPRGAASCRTEVWGGVSLNDAGDPGGTRALGKVHHGLRTVYTRPGTAPRPEVQYLLPTLFQRRPAVLQRPCPAVALPPSPPSPPPPQLTPRPPLPRPLPRPLGHLDHTHTLLARTPGLDLDLESPRHLLLRLQRAPPAVLRTPYPAKRTRPEAQPCHLPRDADAGTGRPGRDVNAHTCLCACASSPDSLLLLFSTLEPYLRIPLSHSPNYRCGYCFFSCTSPRSNTPLSSEPSFSPHRARALALSLLVVARGARSSSSLKESPVAKRPGRPHEPRTTSHASRQLRLLSASPPTNSSSSPAIFPS
ncbi:hypothetical protein BGZ61DRAFT_576308 [Ilyonectria robusta]|uniref:uncharacterized protein n=1 Tax=Ilyonectria robusta TaxID=1079257 RepID=UPI001E8D8DBF|nr:uncharacterized protein BGZ61DRAFT_576308 [Ilyonectria robusta]KAH8706670.1 hypothetical protein BGZ61DRAFT_576308 [Ilyonectria robusta]